MRALVWILVWVVLVVASLVYLFFQVRATWRLTKGFARELTTASDRLAEVQDQVDRLGTANEAIQALAVFESPAQARAERAAVRRTLQEERAGRAKRLPGWARRVDSV